MSRSTSQTGPLTAADIDVTDDIEDVVRKQLLEIGREFDAEVRKLDTRLSPIRTGIALPTAPGADSRCPE
jgi:hypothetical protein